MTLFEQLQCEDSFFDEFASTSSHCIYYQKKGQRKRSEKQRHIENISKFVDSMWSLKRQILTDSRQFLFIM